MPLYQVVMEDLQQVQQVLATQAQGLADTHGQTTQAVTGLNDLTTQALQTGRTKVTEQLQLLTETVNKSNEMAAAAHWTGPDADTFRQSNQDLLAAIQQVSQRFDEAVTQYEAQMQQLMATLEQIAADFAAATQQSQESTARLGGAVGIEAQGYEEAFNGSFAYGG
jgi:predicted kinase